MITSSGNLAALLRPGLNKIFGAAYNRYPDQYKEIFTTRMSNLNYEQDMSYAGSGMGVVKPEGTDVQFDVMQQGYRSSYMHVVYGLGLILTQEAIEDNLYMSQMMAQAEHLAQSLKNVKETVAANILNRAFSGSYLGGDGVALCSASHPLVKGGTFSNLAATPVDLSEYALEQALIAIDTQFLDNAGLQAMFKGRKLVVPPQLRFEAKRILGSDGRVATADNDLNAIKAMGMLPEGFCVNNYLTDTNAWFVLTDCPNGLNHFMRRPLAIDNDTAFESNNVRFKATERYSFGWSDPRCIYGSAGA